MAHTVTFRTHPITKMVWGLLIILALADVSWVGTTLWLYHANPEAPSSAMALQSGAMILVALAPFFLGLHFACQRLAGGGNRYFYAPAVVIGFIAALELMLMVTAR